MTQESFSPIYLPPSLHSISFLTNICTNNSHKSGQNSFQQIKGPKLQRYNNDNLDLFVIYSSIFLVFYQLIKYGMFMYKNVKMFKYGG